MSEPAPADPIELDLVPLFLDVVDALRPPTPAVVIEHPEHCRVRTDPELLSMLLHLLVGNAIKHARMRAEIRVVLGSRPGCSFFIRDNGCGFDPATAATLFRSDREDYDAAGPRLPTVSAQLARQGGRIWAEGESGWGATFLVILPHVQEIHPCA